MPRYRIKYEKGQKAMFSGHLDTMKNFERAFRRAGLPLAFSQGFNPHPKISFASPLAVGVTGEAEYVDVHFKEPMEPSKIKELLVHWMPPGFSVVEVIEVEESLPALMAEISTAHYVIEVPLTEECSQNSLEEELTNLLQQETIEVARQSKKGRRIKDIKDGIQDIKGTIKEKKLELEVVLDSGSSNNIRPEEILRALEGYTKLPIDLEISRVHRRGVYTEKLF